MKIWDKYMREISHWAIFIMAAVMLTSTFVEALSHESLKILVNNPECAQYSYLVN